MSNNIDLVIFGARGDLSKRKLFPALYHLDKAGLLADSVRIAGVAREEIDTVAFIEQTHALLQTYVDQADWDEAVWGRFSHRLQYIRIDFAQKKQFSALKDWSLDKRTMVFYMATPPSIFGSICKHLDEAGCVDKTHPASSKCLQIEPKILGGVAM